MVVGFNHNFRYSGSVYHVQTEDGGPKHSTVTTLLYRGGAVLASEKTSYSDMPESAVEVLMKNQHREMARRLKDGAFDEIIAGLPPGEEPAIE